MLIRENLPNDVESQSRGLVELDRPYVLRIIDLTTEFALSSFKSKFSLFFQSAGECSRGF